MIVFNLISGILRAHGCVRQVLTWTDDADLGSTDAVKSEVAAALCADSSDTIGCSLRAAFTYATSFSGSVVEISLDVQEDLILTQASSIPVKG